MHNIMLCVQKLIREASDGLAFSDTSYCLKDGTCTRNYTGLQTLILKFWFRMSVLPIIIPVQIVCTCGI